MQRVVNIAKNHDEASQRNIKQATEMSHEERQEIALALKKRVYGAQCIDVRASYKSDEK